jgi:uncharacterized protein YndB with AHSA1/START domain
VSSERVEAEAVVREIWIGAPPETVFAYLVDAEKFARWKGRSADLDPRPGGRFRVTIDGQNIAAGRYLEIEPFRKVVFTFGWEGEGSPVPPGASTVEITLVPENAGTRLRLRHMGLPEALRARHAEGWEHYLPRLASAASGSDPGPDPWADPGGGM